MYEKIFFLSILVLIFPTSFAHAEVVQKDLGLVNDFLASEKLSDFYFFEVDESVRSQTWIQDTKIMQGNGDDIKKISEDLFIYPTEINQMGEYLIFAVLSEECIGNIACDFQNVIKMSITDGKYQKIISHLKSAIHISVEGEYIYLSESNGKIWKYSHDGKDGHLIYEGGNLIMDITSLNNEVYWIEEISDQNSLVMRLKNNQVTKIAENLQIPYDLSNNGKHVFWNEILIGPKDGNVKEFTKFTIYDGDKIQTIAEYNNKTPISTFAKPVYGPYAFLEDFLFIANNTSDKYIIHLLDFNTNQNYELETIRNYNVHYFRNNFDSLYVIGQNENGFLIDKIPLPVTVPEFPTTILILSIFLGLTVAMRKVTNYFYQPKIW